jgi:hypothetical protein
VCQIHLPCAIETSLNLYRLPGAFSTRVWNCATKCVGFSGRELAKMLLLMHAVYLNRTQYTFMEALAALEKMVEDKLEERRQMNNGHGGN